MKKCAFVNTEELPVRASPNFAYRVSEGFEDGRPVLNVFLVREYFYRHPDAPENAVLGLVREDPVEVLHKDDPKYSAAYVLLHAQKAFAQLQKQKNKFVE